MNLTKHLLTLCTLLFCYGPFAQTTTEDLQTIPLYKRVSIANPDEEQIHILQELGVDLTCGATYQNGHLKLELDEFTLLELEEQSINYTVLIENLSAHYPAHAYELTIDTKNWMPGLYSLDLQEVGLKKVIKQ